MYADFLNRPYYAERPSPRDWHDGIQIKIGRRDYTTAGRPAVFFSGSWKQRGSCKYGDSSDAEEENTNGPRDEEEQGSCSPYNIHSWSVGNAWEQRHTFPAIIRRGRIFHRSDFNILKYQFRNFYPQMLCNCITMISVNAEVHGRTLRFLFSML